MNNATADEDQVAGPFLSWLQGIRGALLSGTDVGVPCGDCRACCTSSYFIHIRPEERNTLARIPEKLRFPAPGLPEGHVLLGYDKHGHCPMFVDNGCSIYADRPQTCRTYDCRVFAATGFQPDADRKLIARQSARWQFEYRDDKDRSHLAALQLTARFLQEHPDCFPAGFVPNNPTQQAVLAIEVYQVFLNKTPDTAESGDQSRQIARAMVAARQKFEVAPKG